MHSQQVHRSISKPFVRKPGFNFLRQLLTHVCSHAPKVRPQLCWLPRGRCKRQAGCSNHWFPYPLVQSYIVPVDFNREHDGSISLIFLLWNWFDRNVHKTKHVAPLTQMRETNVLSASLELFSSPLVPLFWSMLNDPILEKQLSLKLSMRICYRLCCSGDHFGSLLAHFWTSFSSLGAIWDHFGSGAEFWMNFAWIMPSILMSFSCDFLFFQGCHFMVFFKSFPKHICLGFDVTCVHLGSQREARERSFASFLVSRRSAEKWRSVYTEHHILTFGTARFSNFWITFWRLVSKRRCKWKKQARAWLFVDLGTLGDHF